jgi:hypothetical protein
LIVFALKKKNPENTSRSYWDSEEMDYSSLGSHPSSVGHTVNCQVRDGP